MKFSSRLGISFVLLALLGASACSESTDAPGGGGAGGDAPAVTGGASSASGGVTGSGGALPTSGGAPSSSGGTSPTSSVGDLVSEQQFNSIFPNRAALYTYRGFIEATQHPLMSDFAATGTDEQRRRELAAFFANIAHETTGGWADAPGGREAWGLYFIEEQGCQGGCPGYCVWTDPSNPPPEGHHPCAAGKSYHGRGPIQISYNYNYGQAAAALNEPILAQPELVGTDPKITFETALWFWMSGKSGGELTCHDVMKQGLGFGGTIRIINGIECNGGGADKVQSRVAHYQKFCELLGITPGDNLTC